MIRFRVWRAGVVTCALVVSGAVGAAAVYVVDILAHRHRSV